MVNPTADSWLLAICHAIKRIRRIDAKHNSPLTHIVYLDIIDISLRIAVGWQGNQGGKLSDIYFTSAPDSKEHFKVGDRVDVYCDHEDPKGDRVRDWLVGTIVQVDPKMIAVQFQENVYLTDGWMVPDHVLWYPKMSNNVRPLQNRKRRPHIRMKS